MSPLTKPQYETLMFIRKYYFEKGYMPTHKEISEQFKVDVGGSTAHRIQKLVDKGYILRGKGPRNITLIGD